MLAGHFYTDDLTFGTDDSKIVIKKQKFGNVEEEKDIFNGDFEAIIGLAYPALAEPGVTPVFDNMMGQHLLKNNMFAFYLGAAADNGESDLTFGYYDKTKYTGDLVWHPVLLKYMFGVALDDIKVGGKSLGICGKPGSSAQRTNCLITVDSGSTMMAMPTWAYTQMKTIPTMTNQVDCTSQDDFGDLTWVINGHEYTFKSNEWIYPPQAPTALGQTQSAKSDNNIVVGDDAESTMVELALLTEQVNSAAQNTGSKMQCLGSLMQMDLKDDMFLVGDIFMRKYYTVFDRDNDRVGLAPAIHSNPQ